VLGGSRASRELTKMKVNVHSRPILENKATRKLLFNMVRASRRRDVVACVTGATGFLASELVSQLLSRGYTVQATVRSLASTTKLAHLTELPNAANNLRLFEADLLAEGAFDGCVAGADVIFHTASPFVTTNITDAQQQLYDPALKGTQNVFASIARAGSKPRVVLTSSVAAVLGKATDKATCFDEDDWNSSSKPEGNPPGDGLDLYRYSKLIAEREAWALAERQGLEMAAICPSFIMGPPRTRRLDGESISNMAMALEGLLPHRPDTPLVDVRDCAAAHVAAAETAAAVGKRFITSSRRPMQRAEMLRWLAEAHPELAIHDAGSPQARDDCLGWIPTGA
jgi:nucleoside-diphosphate-sugar epimerase